MTISRRFLASSVAAGLALALAACSGTEETADTPAGEPIAAIPAPDGQAWTDVVAVTPEDGYLVGNPNAPIKLIEYASHTCGHCAQFAADGSPQLKKQYVSTGVVSLELRNLVRDPLDLTIAALVRCGQPQNMMPLADQAWASIDAIFDNANRNGAALEAAAQLPPQQRFVGIAQATGLIDFFAARGLSSEQARTCLSDNAKIEAIAARSQQQGTELNVTGTPTFFLNGKKLEVNTWQALEPILQTAGAR
uniref:DsbA family protein n=1 Tax=Altererythrobacter sp. Z27 TaxID=3461147 RepID=UPI0040440460